MWQLKRSIVRDRLAGLGFLALVAFVSPASVQAQDESRQGDAEADATGIEATLLRTWSGDELTLVDGLAQVPLAMMAGGTTGAYRFELTVFDGDGTALYRDSWERSLSERAVAFTATGSSTLLEPFRFGVRPGSYEVEIRTYPTDAPDLGSVTRLSLESYEDQPVASDLFLADRVEPLDEEGGGSWSVTHAGFGISAVANMTVLSRDPRLFYYVELYGATDVPAEVQVKASVLGEGKRVIYTTPARTEQVPVGGSPLAGSLSLDGLPPGEYELQLALDDGTGETVRTADFRVVEMTAQREGASSYETEYFASLGEDELAETFGGVGYLVSEAERQAYKSLPPDGKRRYLADYFARRDPSPGTAGNAFLEEYIDRVSRARMLYGELVGTEERPPWMTDAGRLYLQYGEPDERTVNHYPSGSDTRPVGGRLTMQGEVPYEIWSYHSTGYVYLFVQETQFGNWRLVFTTDNNMRSLADWQERVGSEALRDLTTRFGVQPRF